MENGYPEMNLKSSLDHINFCKFKKFAKFFIILYVVFAVISFMSGAAFVIFTEMGYLSWDIDPAH